MRKRFGALLAMLSVIVVAFFMSAAPAQAQYDTDGCGAYTNLYTRRDIQPLMFGSVQWGYVRLYQYNSNGNGYCMDTITIVSTLRNTPHHSYVILYDAHTNQPVYTAESSSVTWGLFHSDYYFGPFTPDCVYARGRIDDLAGHLTAINTNTFCMPT